MRSKGFLTNIKTSFLYCTDCFVNIPLGSHSDNMNLGNANLKCTL